MDHKVEKKLIYSELDSESYVGMIVSAANLLYNNKDHINKLNVFPVPDGDTGSNMSMTMSALTVDMSYNKNLSEAADKIADTCLRSARGNSGVILSLFFRGLSKGFKNQKSASISEIVNAYQIGVKEAYNAVQHPTEGTILTVMRVGIESVVKDIRSIKSVNDLFGKILEYSKNILLETPNMLPQLKQAKVVDAGGSGFVSVLEGIVSYLNGNPVKISNDSESVSTDNTVDFDAYEEFDEEHPYCTECIITKSNEFIGEGKASSFKDFIMNAGNSAVFVDTDELIKVHVHTNDPGRVLSEAIKYGKFFSVKIENMENQHTSLLHNNEKNDNVSSLKESTETEYGFVAVTPGDGIMETFRELGVNAFVKGGQTMNPSTEQLLKAISEVNSKTVFILPNNSNICLVANQCVSLSKDKNVVVIPTTSVPQGISAVLAFDPDMSVQDNIESMEEASGNVTTLEITYAARTSEFSGKTINEGQILGLVDHKVQYICNTISDCVNYFLDEFSDAYYITLYYGSDISEEEANETYNFIKENIPEDCELSLIYGGQPLYYYIISVE